MLRQKTLPLRFEEFKPEQYQRMTDIYNRNYPGYDRSATEWRIDDEHLDRSKYYFKRYTCITTSLNDPVGFGQVQHGQWTFHPKKFWIDIWVDPKHQKQGIGSAIYDTLDRELCALGAITVWAQAREDKKDSIEFLSKRGFTEKMRAWESHLDPGQVDLTKYEEYPRKAAAEGIAFTSLAQEMKAEPGWERKLYDIVQTVAGDMPMPEQYTPMSFEQWQAFEMKSPSLLPDGYMIAKHQSEFVGVSTVWKQEKKPGNLWQGITGVQRQYRGKGIAISMKLRVIDYARRNNYSFIRTFNDSTNAPMLGINMKLGFKQEVGWITFEKKA